MLRPSCEIIVPRRLPDRHAKASRDRRSLELKYLEALALGPLPRGATGLPLRNLQSKAWIEDLDQRALPNTHKLRASWSRAPLCLAMATCRSTLRVQCESCRRSTMTVPASHEQT